MDGQRDIFIACSVGDLQWLERSISGCEKITGRMVNHEGLTPLHVAARYGNVGVLKYLLNRCPNISIDVATFDSRETPLHSCLCLTTTPPTFAIDCVKLLLDRGANCNKVNKFSQTPLHIAAENGLTEVVKVLLSKGANDSIKDVRNHTPLDLAKLNGHYESARLLQALLWGRQKDSATHTKIHVQRTMKEQMRLQFALQKAAKQQENQAAYREWLENKHLDGTKPPQACNQRKKERLSSDNATCHSCFSVNETKTDHKAKARHGDSDMGAARDKKQMISKIEISLDQAEHNVLAVGKPDRLYPYSNYPPRTYRRHTSQQQTSTLSASRPSSSRSRRHKRGRSSSRLSIKSMPTPRLGGSTPTSNTRSLHSMPVLPPSYVSYSIHNPNKDIHDQESTLPTETNSCHDNNSEDEKEVQEEEEEEEENGSTSSIDGLTFHEVGPENNIQTLVSLGDPAGSNNAIVSTLTPMELYELFRLSQQENLHPKLHRRHSTGTHSGSRRPSRYQRAISLSAIPEGEILTRYDDQREGGSRLFDEKFLLSLMPYAFAKELVEGESKESHSTKEMELTPNEELPDSVAEPYYNSTNKNSTLKVVTVAWDEEVNEVKTVLLDEKKLSPRLSPRALSPASSRALSPSLSSSSPVTTPANVFASHSDTSLSQFEEKESKNIDHSLVVTNRVKSATTRRNKEKELFAGTDARTLNGRNVLKTTLYRFGGDLVYTN